MSFSTYAKLINYDQDTSKYFIFVLDEGSESTTSFYASTNSSFEIDWKNNNEWMEITTDGIQRISFKFETKPDTIKIRGEMNIFKAPQDIKDVIQWGDVGFTSLDDAFKKCYKLKKFSANDTPNLSKVVSMNRTFARCEKFNGDLSQWDVSNVTSMVLTFYHAENFNGDLSQWDVSKVEDMRFMFCGANRFISDISNWDVSKVKNMRKMFYEAFNFNADISNWNTESLENMNSMFYNARAFNRDLSNWDISNVYKMYEAFINTRISNETYDKLLHSWASQDVQDSVYFGISSNYCDAADERRALVYDHNWYIDDHGPCDDYNFIFQVKGKPGRTISFEAQSVNTFYVDWENNNEWEEVISDSAQIKVSHYFEGEPSIIKIKGDLNKFVAPKNIIDVLQWGDVAFTTLNNMFHFCKSIEGFTATDTPNLSRVTTMQYAFASAYNFNGDISTWDVSEVTSMRSAFAYTRMFNNDISSWDVSNVKNMKQLFYNAISFNQNIEQWNVSNVNNMVDMLEGTNQFSSENYDNLLDSWSKLENGLQEDVKFDVSSTYCQSADQRQKIIDDYGWIITDGGSNCPTNYSSSYRNSKNGLIKDELNLNSGLYEGDVYWSLYDFNGNILSNGHTFLQKGEKLKWWDFEMNSKKAGILKVYDKNKHVSIMKFIKQ
ncbi:BspA family leucine-rich repeat surface protein [Flammeovirga aprica]|uniref:DUF285 domain-containing protein n=1 Tax=Flammeovirga aprica JL-4 TaxID=694437 RepID=A0A7X9NZZ7_9BACT|nr:BspA family leucine-rich repeat surface protein [Flammeovirga aprica]NME66800.1 DUF285 domain-containing protein [Flammeovirga aprica JL-4]